MGKRQTIKGMRIDMFLVICYRRDIKNQCAKSAEMLPWLQEFIAMGHGPERAICLVGHFQPMRPE